jgi:hypothetical protein
LFLSYRAACNVGAIVDGLKQAPAAERSRLTSRLQQGANMPTNDDHLGCDDGPNMPDPHGQAALLLVESLIHSLVARSIIGTADAVEITETAQSVLGDMAEDADGTCARIRRSEALLSVIAQSLRIDDQPTEPFSPAA